MFSPPPERPFPPPAAPPASPPLRQRKLPRWLSLALYCTALAAAFWRLPQPTAASFAPLASPPPTSQSTAVTNSQLPATRLPAEATLSLLPDGRLAAAWSATCASDENERCIWFSLMNQDGWRPARVIASRESTAAGTFTHADRLGQPMLHSEGSWLHLWYVSHDGLAGASFNHSVSTNSGQTWSKPAKLPLAPLAAGNLLPGSPPVALADGGLGLPLSRSALGDHGEWLRLSATGKILDKQRLPQSADNRQPALVVLDTQHALAFLRDAGPVPGKLRRASTDNGGQSWQAAAPLPIANNNTPLAALRLPSGRLLLAGNPESGRASLQLWLSADAGLSWQPSRVIEAAADGAADFSQPALLLGRDGRIHLAYSWRQREIRLSSFNEAWLGGGAP